MKATLIFRSHESHDLSIGMVFTPCICWVINKEKILNPHPDKPEYLKGDFQRLIQLPIFDLYKDDLSKRKIALVIHNEGHGSQVDISNLIEDIKDEKFELQILSI